MSRKDVQGNIISALIAGMISVTVLFVGPFRNMASADDIKDFVTMPEVKAIIPSPDNRYAEDRNLLMNYMEKIDKLSENITTLITEVATLNVKVETLTAEMRSSSDVTSGG